MTELRAKCPWDKEQTFESLRTLTIEETYELADAIIRDDKKEIRKELGDILLHIVFYSEMGSETQDFDIYDVCKGLCEKLIYRHPHIFADPNGDDYLFFQGNNDNRKTWFISNLKIGWEAKRPVFIGI